MHHHRSPQRGRAKTRLNIALRYLDLALACLDAPGSLRQHRRLAKLVRKLEQLLAELGDESAAHRAA